MMLPSILSTFTSLNCSNSDFDTILRHTIPVKNRYWEKKFTPIAPAPIAPPYPSSGDSLLQVVEACSADSYSELHADEMKMLLVRRDDRIDELMTQARLDRMKKARLQARFDQLQEQTNAYKDEIQELNMIVNFRPGRNVSSYGGYSLALCRNYSHIGWVSRNHNRNDEVEKLPLNMNTDKFSEQRNR